MASRLQRYLPLEKSLPTDPKVRRMARAVLAQALAPNLPAATCLLLGALSIFWTMADDHAEADGDDALLCVDGQDVAELVGFDLLAIMPPTWAREDQPGCFRLPGFWTKNGMASKQRMEAAARKRESRDRVSQKIVTARPENCDRPSRENVTSDPIRSDPNLSNPERHTDPPAGGGRVHELRVRDQDGAEIGNFLQAYPAHAGAEQRDKVEAKLRRLISTQTVDWPTLIDSARRYARYCNETQRTGTQYVKTPLQFLREGLWRERFAIPEESSGYDGVRAAIGAVDA